jgi:hypothetical protein
MMMINERFIFTGIGTEQEKLLQVPAVGKDSVGREMLYVLYILYKVTEVPHKFRDNVLPGPIRIIWIIPA